jgi:predicted nucleic acid-binding protein
VIAVDTSVVVAAFASWHQFHRLAVHILDRSPALPMQAALEAYSVLTRLPAPHRAPPGLAREFIEEHFSGALLTLGGESFAALLSEMAAMNIVGGAAFDGVVGAAARDAGRVLVTFDARARQTYDRLGVAVEYAV